MRIRLEKKITLYNYYQYRTVKCQNTGHVIINEFMFTLSRQLICRQLIQLNCYYFLIDVFVGQTGTTTK